MSACAKRPLLKLRHPLYISINCLGELRARPTTTTAASATEDTDATENAAASTNSAPTSKTATTAIEWPGKD